MMKKLNPEQPVVAMGLTGVIEDIGAAESKAMSPGRRYRYSQAGFYVLEDGTRFETIFRALTKPKLQERLNNQVRYINNRELFAEQWQDGENVYWSTSWRVTIGLCSR